MNILLVEDNEHYLAKFKEELSKLGTVTSFKSSNGARRFLLETEIKFDLVVCDHNIQRFEEESRHTAYGTEIYEEFRWGLESETPFIHFSSEPCPENYDGSKEDKNFYSLKKDHSTALIQFIEQNGLKK